MTNNSNKIRVSSEKNCSFERFTSRSQAALLGFFLTSTMMTQAFAADFVINNGDTAGLIAAINSVNTTAGTHTITLASGGTYNLAQIGGTNMGLPAITGSVSINGNGATIDGQGNARAFVIGTGATTANVTLSNVTIRNTLAVGGTGSGGGLGAGGAVYVGSTGNVTVTNVTMQANAARGGAGGSNLGNGTNALAGGGMVTNGGSNGVGGNGLAGTGGGTAGTNVVTGSTNGGIGGTGGGGGGGLVNGQGGAGGFGGGGGGSINSGTAIGGDGGFGGGGGATGVSGTGGVGGFGGGNGGNNAGGGGAGLGGAVFVQQGGSLTLGSGGSLSGNTTTGGLSGGAGGTSGSAGGNGIFLQGSGTFNIAPGGGNTTTINDVITDQYGMTHATADVNNRYGVVVTGPGTVVFGGANTYSGQVVNGQTIGTTVTGGAIVSVTNNANLGDTSAQIKLDNGELRTAASMTSNRGIILGAGGGTLNTAGNTLTHSGIITGTGTLTTNGGGTVNLSGSNSFSGGTIVDQATLGISTDTPNGTGNLGSGSVTLRNNGTLRLNSNTNLYRNTIVDGTNGTINSNGFNNALLGTISGAGQVTLTNTTNATTTLLNAITTTNGVVISSGTLRLVDGAGAYPGGSILGPIVNNGTLEYNRSADLTLNQVISGTGAFTQMGPNTITMTGDNTYTGVTTVNGGSLGLGNGGTTGSVAGNIQLNNGSTLGINRSGTATIGNNIAGNGSVAINGPGVVTLNGANTFTGNLLLNNGYIATNSDSSLGGAGSSLIFNGGGLRATGNFAVNRPITLNAGGGHIDTNGFNITENGVISGVGALIKEGTGNLSLTSANTYSGGTTIATGTLDVSGAGTLGTGAVAVNSAGTLGLNAVGTVANVISGSGNVSVGSGGLTVLTGNSSAFAGNTTINNGSNLSLGNGGATGSLGGTLVNNGTLTVNRNNAVELGAISGTGGLVQAGTGTTSLTGANTYSGGTSVNAGTLAVSGAGTLGTGGVAINSPGTVGLNAVGTVGNVFTGNGALNVGSGGLTALTGDSAAFAGTTTVGAGSNLSLGNGGSTGIIGGAIVNNGILTVNRNNAVTLANPISGTGSLVQEGTGTTSVTAANSFTGGSTINHGTLALTGAGTLGTGAVAVNSAGTLGLNAVGTVANVISGSGNVSVGSGGLTVLTGNSSAFAGNTTINNGSNLSLGNGGATGSLGGTLVNNGVLTVNRENAVELGAISGTGGLVQAGTGTTSLTGANTYSGGTSVNQGTLELGNGGTTGALTGDVTLNGGTFAVNRSNAVTLNNNIIGTGNFANNGTGTTTLTGANSFIGTVNLNAGAVAIGNNSQLGNSANAINMNGGRLITTAPMTINRSITLLAPGGGTIETTAPNVTTLSGVIAGPGALTTAGTGTVALTGANTYAGGTNVTGGTLELGTGGALGTGGVNLATGTNLNLNSTAPVTVGNIISGAGTVNQNGAGTTTLAAVNTYSGGTNINAGAIEVNNNGALGTGGVNIAQNGALTLNSANPLVLTNAVTGNGVVNQNGAGGTTILGLNPTFTGVTNVNAGNLTLGNGTTAGTLGGTINTAVGTGVIANAGAGTVTLPANITGAGTFTTNGPGTTVYVGNANQTGGTIIASGTLQLGNGVQQGTIAGNIANNGTLAINNANPTVLSGVISGTGNAVVLANNNVTMLGNNTYTGTTTIDQTGTLNLGNGGTTGTVAGNIINNGTLGINHSNGLTLAGNITGTGNLNHTGAGTTNLTGTTSYLGTTSVSNGILNVSGNINGPVVTSGVGQINVGGTVNGAMSVGGTGGLGATGVINGPLTITSGGVYSVNGTVTGNVNVAQGGTLQGTGQMGSIINAGTFAPGNSVGTATVVTGDLTLLASGNYQIEINPTDGDRVNISKRANLAGGFELLPLPPNGAFTQGYRYNVINAGQGVNGQFQTFTAQASLFGTNIRPILQYNENNVEVVLQAERLTPLTTNLSRNNQTLARYFDASTLGQAAASTTTGASTRGALTPIYNSSAARMSNALDQMSGQVSMGAGVTVTRVGGAFMDAMMGAGLSAQPDPVTGPTPNFAEVRPMSGDFERPQQGFAAGRRVAGSMSNPYDEKELIDARPYDKNNKTRTAYLHKDHSRIDYTMTATVRNSFERQYAGWGQAIGGFGSNKGDATIGINQVESSFAGVAGGYTYRPEKGVTVGFGLSGVHAGHTVANGLGSGTADGMSLGVFGKVETEKVYVAGTAGVGLYQFGTNRQMNLVGNTDTLKGSYNGTWFGARGEIGMDFVAGKSIVSPYVAVQNQMVRTNGYSETNQTGAQTGLTFASRNHVSTRSELGINVETKRKLNSDQWMTVRGTVAWSHEFMPINSMTASLTQLPGASFVLQGARATTDAMLIAASAELQIKKSWSLNARISGEFSERSSQIIGQVGAKYMW